MLWLPLRFVYNYLAIVLALTYGSDAWVICTCAHIYSCTYY